MDKIVAIDNDNVSLLPQNFHDLVFLVRVTFQDPAKQRQLGLCEPKSGMDQSLKASCAR